MRWNSLGPLHKFSLFVLSIANPLISQRKRVAKAGTMLSISSPVRYDKLPNKVLSDNNFHQPYWLFKVRIVFENGHFSNKAISMSGMIIIINTKQNNYM